MGFLDDYQPVEDRIRLFWDDHPDGRIITSILPAPDGHYIFNASVFKGAGSDPDATGHAEETVGSSNVNKTSALENCETSAIGRALANLGYAPKGARPSREEMSKAAPDGTGRGAAGSSSSYQCPDSGHGIYDNRESNIQRVADGGKAWPAFKCQDKSCGWVSWDDGFFDPQPIREDYDAAPPPEFPPGEEPF